MNKKNIFLLVALVVLAAAYAYFFTNWFRPRRLEIFHVSRSFSHGGRRVRAANPDTRMVIFGLNGRYRLTDVKVVPLDEWQTNHAVVPMWHLVSDSNSVPVKEFRYGATVRGMKPAPGERWPKPLDTNETYRIFVEAGSLKGQHDFTTVPKGGVKSLN